MKRKTCRLLSICSALVLMFCLGATGALAQKGGKGGGHGNGHGNGNGRGNGWGNGGQPGPKMERQGGWQGQRQMPQVQRQMPQANWPGVQAQPQYQMRQDKHAWKQQRKQERDVQRVWQQPQVMTPQRRQGPPPWAGVWRAPGQIVKQQRREEKEYRKAVREENKRQRTEQRAWQNVQPEYQYRSPYRVQQPSYRTEYYRQAPSVQYSAPYHYEAPRAEYYPNYSPQQYRDPYRASQYSVPQYYAPLPIISGGEYYYPEQESGIFGNTFDGSNWTEMLLGTVLDAFLGGSLNGREIVARPSYDDYYGGEQAYAGYYPVQQYGRPDMAYSNNGYSDQYYSPVLFSYPTSLNDNEYIDELTRRAFNAGYEKGFLAGQAARNYGYRDADYENPYFYEDTGYGYGAYSISLNRERRLLSEGYDRGYQDALNRDNLYDAQNGGDVDLVSLLISSALGMFDI